MASNPYNIPKAVDVSPELRDLFKQSRALRNQRGRINVDLRLEKGDCAVVITLDAPKGSMLASMASWLPTDVIRAWTLDSVKAEVANNVIYIRPLEWGHSQQKPNGFMRLALRTFANYVVEEMRVALERHPEDPRAGLQAGLDSALLRIQAYLVANTPVKSGRAKGAWVVKRQDGAMAPVTSGASSRAGRGALSRVVRAVEDAAAEVTQ